MVHQYKCKVSEHYPSSCLYFTRQRFGVSWAQSIELVPISGLALLIELD
jgi:hypothetical protein